ncbi:MAG TPA: extracellular solute-binding protein [Acetobacteraceae bacterium]|nr:extracellular solute-binding protein [Acetobacteraceae bacterium]
MRRRTLLTAPALLALPRLAHAAPVLRVAYAGSMGVVMDRVLGPDFAKAQGCEYQGIAQGAYGLARLIAAGTLQADLFISITAGPVRVVQQAGKAGPATPVASTEMVIAYSKESRFAPRFANEPWWKVLESPGLRFGRTDPVTDPQGRNIIFTLELAERFYGQRGLAERVLGPTQNPAQIFTEPSLLSRLEAGQLDAASGYRSATVSHGLPMVALPPEVNLGDPAMDAEWYSKVSITLDGKEVRPEPLVFYAVALNGAAEPALARAFIAYLTSPAGQSALAGHGYSPPRGGVLPAA